MRRSNAVSIARLNGFYNPGNPILMDTSWELRAPKITVRILMQKLAACQAANCYNRVPLPNSVNPGQPRSTG